MGVHVPKRWLREWELLKSVEELVWHVVYVLVLIVYKTRLACMPRKVQKTVNSKFNNNTATQAGSQQDGQEGRTFYVGPRDLGHLAVAYVSAHAYVTLVEVHWLHYVE